MRVREFLESRDLPTAGSPTTATIWPRPAPPLQRGKELLHLGVPANKAGQAPRGAACKREPRPAPSARRPRPDPPDPSLESARATQMKPSASCRVAGVSEDRSGGAICSMRAAR